MLSAVCKKDGMIWAFTPSHVGLLFFAAHGPSKSMFWKMQMGFGLRSLPIFSPTSFFRIPCDPKKLGPRVRFLETDGRSTSGPSRYFFCGPWSFKIDVLEMRLGFGFWDLGLFWLERVGEGVAVLQQSQTWSTTRSYIWLAARSAEKPPSHQPKRKHQPKPKPKNQKPKTKTQITDARPGAGDVPRPHSCSRGPTIKSNLVKCGTKCWDMGQGI
jgi:hypothetical protein